MGPPGATANRCRGLGRFGHFLREKDQSVVAAAQMKIELRPATQADIEPLYPIHRDAMRPYVEAMWGPWDETYQQKRFRENFAIGQRQIIVVDGALVGFMDVAEHPDHVWLAELEIAPDFQRRGIGSRLIRDILSA